MCMPRQLGNGRFNTSHQIRTGQGGAGIHDFARLPFVGGRKQESKAEKKEQIGEMRENHQEPGKTLLIGAAIPLLPPTLHLSRFLFPISLLSPFFLLSFVQNDFREDKKKTTERGNDKAAVTPITLLTFISFVKMFRV